MRMLPFSFPRVNGALVSILSVAPIILTQAADWPQYRGPNRDGISREEGLPKTGKATVSWSVNIGLGYSQPVISNGRVVISGHDGKETDTLYCVEEKSGTELWTHSYPQPLGDMYFQGGTTGTATADGDRIYHVAREGELFCLEADTGNVIWMKDLQKDFGYTKPTWGFSGAPLVMGDRLFITAGEAGIALRKHDGSQIWRSENEEAGYSTPYPLMVNGEQYIIFTNKRYYVCVHSDNGKEAWKWKWMTRFGVIAADPVVVEDTIFVSTGYDKGSALLKWGGEGEPKMIWQSREMRTQMNPAVIIGEHIYGFDGNEGVDGTGLKCLDVISGKTIWTEASIGHGALSAVGGELLVLTEQGELQIASATPSGYEPSFSQGVVNPKAWTVPVYANGKVYCRNASGEFVALNMKKDT